MQRIISKKFEKILLKSAGSKNKLFTCQLLIYMINGNLQHDLQEISRFLIQPKIEK
jgi:hypothetical protein